MVFHLRRDIGLNSILNPGSVILYGKARYVNKQMRLPVYCS